MVACCLQDRRNPWGRELLEPRDQLSCNMSLLCRSDSLRWVICQFKGWRCLKDTRSVKLILLGNIYLLGKYFQWFHQLVKQKKPIQYNSIQLHNFLLALLNSMFRSIFHLGMELGSLSLMDNSNLVSNSCQCLLMWRMYQIMIQVLEHQVYRTNLLDNHQQWQSGQQSYCRFFQDRMECNHLLQWT